VVYIVRCFLTVHHIHVGLGFPRHIINVGIISHVCVSGPILYLNVSGVVSEGVSYMYLSDCYNVCECGIIVDLDHLDMSMAVILLCKCGNHM